MIYKFNNIQLDTDKFTLWVNGQEQPLEPQVFNLIVYLIENKDKIISRDELLNNVWKDRVVSDTSINNSIKSARRILGDDGNKQQVIKTIHSRGYQFIAGLDNEPNKEKQLNQHPNTKYYSILFFAFTLLILPTILYIHYNNKNELNASINKISSFQEMSYLTFVAQAKRRDELVNLIETRLGIKQEQQYEKFFSKYFDDLNQQEMFVFNQIRGMTETGLYQNNLKTVDELNRNPQIYSLIPGTIELNQHLQFWLNKYHSIFKSRKDMCLLYVGVEDGVPYPSEVNKNIQTWLKTQD